MALEAYSLAKDGGRRLSANFTVREFACRDGSDPVFVDTRLVQVLQSIRDHFGKPVVITSYYKRVVFIDRSPAGCYNNYRVLWIGLYHLPSNGFAEAPTTASLLKC